MVTATKALLVHVQVAGEIESDVGEEEELMEHVITGDRPRHEAQWHDHEAQADVTVSIATDPAGYR